MSWDYSFKVIIFGDKGTGKEILVERYLTNLFKSDSKMTIGVDFVFKNLEIDGKKVKLQLWDFGGEERFRFLISTYVIGMEGALFVYDVTNYSSLSHFDEWLRIIRKELRAEDQFPIIFVGNKADLDDQREISSEEGIEFAKLRSVNGFIECSAKTGENVEEIFESLTRLMIQKRENKIKRN